MDSDTKEIPAPAVRITCILGRIAAATKDVVVKDADADPNSRRWVFDVEHDTKILQRFSIKLLDFRTRRHRNSMRLSPRWAPFDRDAVNARIRTPEPDVPTFEVDPVGEGRGTIRYRMMLDATPGNAD